MEFTGRIALGESKAVTIGTANKIALVVFDGTAGQRVSLGVSEVSFGNGAGLFEVSILGPYGTTLASKLVSRPDDIDMEPLPDTGTYTIVVDPGALTVNLTLTVSEPMTGAITIDGPSVPVILTRPGQDARLTFEGTAGQRLGLGVGEVSFGTGPLESLRSPSSAPTGLRLHRNSCSAREGVFTRILCRTLGPIRS